jgi:hypothetical protein
MAKLGATSIVAELPTALFVLGLMFGPWLSEIGSGAFGRKLTYLGSILLYSIFILIAGTVKNLPGLVVCRFAAGVFCSPTLHLAFSSLGDMWTAEQTVAPLAVCIAAVFLGTTLGPIIGGYAVFEANWRWTQWIVLFGSATLMVATSLMRETEKTAILQRKRMFLPRIPLGGVNLSQICIKPLRMLFREPLLLMSSLYLAFTAGIFYAICIAFPVMMKNERSYSAAQQGLCVVSMSVGVLVGCIIFLGHEFCVHQPYVFSWRQQKATEGERTLFTGRRSPGHGPKLSAGRGTSITSSPPRFPEKTHNRRSLMQSLKDWSAPGVDNPLIPDTAQRNVRMSYAAANYLNGIEGNVNKRVKPARILDILNQNLEYDHLCAALSRYGLNFDRIGLARALVSASSDGDVPYTDDCEDGTETRRQDATAALASSVEVERVAEIALSERHKTWAPPCYAPPPRWRLWLAAPASLCTASSLLMLGWTTRASVHWIVPVLACVWCAASSTVAFASTTMYLLAQHRQDGEAAAVSASSMSVWLVAAAFSLFACEETKLGPRRGMTVYAALSLGLCSIPLVLYACGRKHRDEPARPALR